jgi:hypothetical protein
MGGALSGVECRSDWSYAGRPLAVTWQGRRYGVRQVFAEWNAPEGPHFKVECELGFSFELIYQNAQDHWLVLPITWDGEEF